MTKRERKYLNRHRRYKRMKRWARGLDRELFGSYIEIDWNKNFIGVDTFLNAVKAAKYCNGELF